MFATTTMPAALVIFCVTLVAGAVLLVAAIGFCIALGNFDRDDDDITDAADTIA